MSLDGEFAFSLFTELAATLGKGQALGPNEIAELLRRDAAQRAYLDGIRFLTRRARSYGEMETYLTRRRGHAVDAVQAAMERLSREKYLDDEVFAAAWVRQRERLSPRSARALHHELRQKGVSDATIARALADFDETAAAWSAAQQRLRHLQAGDANMFRGKLYGFLSRRGFAADTVREIWDRLRPPGA